MLKPRVTMPRLTWTGCEATQDAQSCNRGNGNGTTTQPPESATRDGLLEALVKRRGLLAEGQRVFVMFSGSCEGLNPVNLPGALSRMQCWAFAKRPKKPGIIAQSQGGTNTRKQHFYTWTVIMIASLTNPWLSHAAAMLRCSISTPF